MESIVNFVQAILPEQEKAQILEKIQNVQNEMSQVTIPAYEKMVEYGKQTDFKSAMFTEFSKSAGRFAYNSNGKNIVKDVHRALVNHQTNLEKLTSLVENYRANTVTVESITYKRANVLQLISGIDGFVRYTTRLCGLLWLCETGNIDARALSEVRLPEYSWLRTHRSVFFASLDVGLRDPKKLMATLENMPELTVNEETHNDVEASMGKQKPIVSGFTVTYSPILYLRRLWEDFQEWRINRLKVEKEWLENCHAQAQIAKETGQRNAAVDKRLEYFASKLETTDRKLREISANPE